MDRATALGAYYGVSIKKIHSPEQEVRLIQT